MPGQLEGAEALAQLGAEGARRRVGHPRELHLQGRGAGDHPAGDEVLPGGAHHRQRVDPGVAAEAAVLRRHHRPRQVRSHLGQRQRQPPALVGGEEKPQRRPVGRRNHDRRRPLEGGEGKRIEPVEDQERGERRGRHRDQAGSDPAEPPGSTRLLTSRPEHHISLQHMSRTTERRTSLRVLRATARSRRRRRDAGTGGGSAAPTRSQSLHPVARFRAPEPRAGADGPPARPRHGPTAPRRRRSPVRLTALSPRSSPAARWPRAPGCTSPRRGQAAAGNAPASPPAPGRTTAASCSPAGR